MHGYYFTDRVRTKAELDVEGILIPKGGFKGPEVSELIPRPTWTYCEFPGDVEVRVGTKENEEELITFCFSRGF